MKTNVFRWLKHFPNRTLQHGGSDDVVYRAVHSLARVHAPVVVSVCTVALVLLSGCASMQEAMTPKPTITATRPMGTDFTKVTKYYISYDKEDSGRHAQTLKAVQETLAARGSVAVGPNSAMPSDTECRVEFADHWFWDLGWYLLTLEIKLYDARSGALIGSGSSRRDAPAIRRAPEFMANEVLEAIFHASL